MAFNDSFDQASLDARWAGSTATFDDANDRVDVTAGTLTSVSGTLTPTNWGALDFSFSFIANSDYADWSILLPRNDTQPRAQIRLRSGGVSGGNRVSTTTVLEFVDAQYGAFSGVIGVDGQTDTWLNGENTIRVTRDNSGNWEIFLNGTSKGTGTEPEDLTTYYSTDANIDGVVEFGQGPYYVTSAVLVEANVDPQLDTPEPDHSIETGATGSIDFGDGFSDANSDTLTFSISPDISALTGWSWNSATGVATYDGSQGLLTQTSYTVTATDGQGGTDATDTALIEVVAPQFGVDSVSGGDQPGESWVFALSNDSGAGMTANIGGTALTVTAQTSGSITVTIPDLLTFDGGIHRFNENLTVQIVDGANSDTIATPITPATGFAQVQMPNPIAGVWAGSTFEAAISPGVLEVGDYIHCTAPTDSDPENGIFPEDSTIVYRIMEMSDPTPVWGAAGTITIPAAVVDNEAPVITLTGDATINLSEGDSYTEQGATWTDNIDGSGAATVGGDTVDTATPGIYTVTYNYTDAAGNAATQVTRTVNVANVNDSPTGSVTIDNTTPATGDTLTASNTLADEDGLGEITYQWYRGASPISGATSSTYNVVSADYGAALSVRANYTDQQGTPETVPSAATSAVTDGEAPVITLNGSTTVTHAQGTAYNDAGATALDGVDGNLTGDIVTTGASFDTGTVGTYTVRYNVSDAAGNAATEVTRTVNVTDQTIPVITLTGGDVTLTEGGTYSEPGYTATDNNDGDISNSVVVAGDTVDPSTVGVYTVTYNVDDAAGNSAAQKTRTVTVRAASSTEITANTPFSRTIFVSPNGETGVPVFIKDTSDVIDFLMDFSAALQGDSISVVEVTTSNITLDATYRTGNKVQLWLSGGIAKVMAELKITAQSNAGRTIERSFKVKVGEY